MKATKLSQPLVSHHLRVLKESGILETKRNGPFIYYNISDKKILYAINLFMELFKDTEIGHRSGTGFCADWIIDKYNHKT